MTVTEKELLRIVDDYGQAWNSHDVDEIMAMHTEDTVFRLHLLGSSEVTGKAEVREVFAGLLALWPDIHFATDRISVGPDFFVHQCSITTTLAAPLPLGGSVLQPTGKPMRFSGVDVIGMSGKLVHRKETYLDVAAAMQELGAL
ncbi:nuclear transport factor 2 family protein [Spirillospora sp. CA-142024]|uniref:nuclear transport factor 2 family protein n=1 Tax=Spirillospora sp. CA-142024 TaxID=3240036 RepID=UPI003D939A0D